MRSCQIVTDELLAEDRAQGLRSVVVEAEAHVSREGWDMPTRLYALVPTRELVAAEPELAAELGLRNGSERLLTPVEQELHEPEQSVEDLLGRIAWPAAVAGAAVVVERLMLPPHAEADVPEDPEAATAYVATHAEREDVRITVGVLRTGESHCVVRLRRQDDDQSLVQGQDVVPGLVAAVRETLEAEPAQS